MRHLLDSLWQEATVWFVSQVLLISFSYEQSHFGVERRRQRQGAALQKKTRWATDSQMHSGFMEVTFFFQCHWHHLCVTPVQPLQYDASQPVLHCRQRMLEQPGSNHANLLRARLPEAQGKFFAQVQSHLRHESGKCWHCNRTVTKSPFSNSSIHAIKEKATPTIPTMCIVSLSRSRSTEMM